MTMLLSKGVAFPVRFTGHGQRPGKDKGMRQPVWQKLSGASVLN